MDEVELEFAVRYPFSSSAKKILSESKTALNERIVELGKNRIKKALRGDDGVRIPIHSDEKTEEIAGFAAARMILGTLSNRYVTERFAVNESKSARRSLDYRKKDIEFLKNFFSIKTTNTNGRKLAKIPVFLKYTPHSVHYRLMNREIVSGYVVITESEEKRMVEEAIRKRLMRNPIVKTPPASIRKAGREIIAILPKTNKTIKIKPGDYPPCIREIISEAKKHQNLPHTSRWFLAVYLLAAGMSIKKIEAIYSNLPDYDRKKTRYQLEHAKAKGYKVPSCSTVASYGLCVAKCGITNPINWRKKNESKNT